ncbi:helix-turn-helix transcriptional regulator [Caenispirillum salinarum]|uniref:helix-turn-helix transcriptional regulator n=1 Tax=Caenispirillum salinarum TaxID=859058 RepID=UPI0005BA95BA|nr:helix-turn-helix transcriptional regulator [Caenispirillum salinarum]
MKNIEVDAKILTPSQSRAARALLGWSQQQLAEKAEVAKQTLADFERGARTPYDRTLRDIRSTLEDAGVLLLDSENGLGVGARLKG